MEQLRARWVRAGRLYSRITTEGAQLIDVLIGVAVAAAGVVSSDGGDGALGAVAIGACLALRRRYTTACYLGVFLATTLTGHDDAWGTFLGLLIAAGTLASYARYRLVAFLLLMATIAVVTVEFGGNLEFIPTSVVPFLILGSIWVAGSAIHKRQRRADESEERAQRLEREQEQERQLALAAERTRIAHELHDVVTHTVNVMLVQAGAARTKLTRDPEASKQALLAVEATGREALHDLRSFLGVLDGNGHTPVDLRPQPGLADVDALLQRIEQAGLHAELVVRGERTSLPAAIDLTAYRVVQESLTNALKYAARARTEVALDYRADGIAVEVVDDGPGVAPGAAGGRGLNGLRERVAAYGGTFEAGRRPSGGFAVRAWLPASAAMQ